MRTCYSLAGHAYDGACWCLLVVAVVVVIFFVITVLYTFFVCTDCSVAEDCYVFMCQEGESFRCRCVTWGSAEAARWT